MSYFGSNLNQIKDSLPCRFQMLLVWHVGHRMQQLHLKFPIRKEERRESRLPLYSFLLTVKLQSSARSSIPPKKPLMNLFFES